MLPLARLGAADPIARGRGDTPPGRSVEFSIADHRLAALLGGRGLRDPPALRCRGRRRHLPSGDGAARAWTRALARRLCPALAPADGWPLRREPQSPGAVLSVSGHPEACAGR